MKLLDIIFESVVDMEEGRGSGMTKDDFIKQSKEINKNDDGSPKYTYNKTNFVRGNRHVIITCSIHGDFSIGRGNHLKGQGCPKCASIVRLNKINKFGDDFIKQSKEIHKDENGKPLYGYDNVKYKSNNTKVNLTCPIHGDFTQFPVNHLKGHGCAKCGFEKTRQGLTKTNEDFISQAREVHKDENGNPLYGYDNVNYINDGVKVKITCPIHGDFSQNPNSHLQGSNCPKCAGIVSAKKRTKSDEDFIRRAQNVHKDENDVPLYTYDNINYVNTKKKINITCPTHGDFSQVPSNHLQGQGCPKCNEYKGEKTLKNYFIENKIKFNPQEKFTGCFVIGGKTKKCYELPFDFYLSDEKIVVEIDGYLHFTDMYGEEKFKNRILNDKLKNKFVESNNDINKFIRIYHDGKNFQYLITEFKRLVNDKSPNKIVLSSNYPNEGWNK